MTFRGKLSKSGAPHSASATEQLLGELNVPEPAVREREVGQQMSLTRAAESGQQSPVAFTVPLWSG